MSDSQPTKKHSWSRMKAVKPAETEEARRARLQKKLEEGAELEEDEITDILELAQEQLRDSHGACTQQVREQIAETESKLEKG